MHLFRNSMQLLSHQCQLLHFAKLKTDLLEEFQDELLKITQTLFK